MHPAISQWPNSQFYSGRVIDDSSVRAREPGLLLHPSTGENAACLLWESAGCDLGGQEQLQRVRTVGAGGVGSRCNLGEADRAATLAMDIARVAGARSVAVLSWYNNQVAKVTNILRGKPGGSGIHVGSIATAQGSEWDYVILSAVRSGSGGGSLGLVACPHNLNVALTRAKLGLVILCDTGALRRDRNWNGLIERCSSDGLLVTGRPRLSRRPECSMNPERVVYPAQHTGEFGMNQERVVYPVPRMAACGMNHERVVYPVPRTVPPPAPAVVPPPGYMRQNVSLPSAAQNDALQLQIAMAIQGQLYNRSMCFAPSMPERGLPLTQLVRPPPVHYSDMAPSFQLQTAPDVSSIPLPTQFGSNAAPVSFARMQLPSASVASQPALADDVKQTLQHSPCDSNTSTRYTSSIQSFADRPSESPSSNSDRRSLPDRRGRKECSLSRQRNSSSRPSGSKRQSSASQPASGDEAESSTRSERRTSSRSRSETPSRSRCRAMERHKRQRRASDDRSRGCSRRAESDDARSESAELVFLTPLPSQVADDRRDGKLEEVDDVRSKKLTRDSRQVSASVETLPKRGARNALFNYGSARPRTRKSAGPSDDAHR
eukprot:TRINITY_DN3504_c0_g1_i2.p1 TRINITY_DN3504_c0_g1~~TRINITY_DN3504_c0_g1_i2.p1  ORF type:complete len:603 (+),score=32.03 TRINITY_DN3504_c0_g1_i2:214-2022(+)